MAGTTIVTPASPLFDEARSAVAGFLARYSGPTRRSYATDLRQFFSWCARSNFEILELKRGPHRAVGPAMEKPGLARATIGRRLSTVSGFYRIAVLDGLMGTPRPSTSGDRRSTPSRPTSGLDRMELSAFGRQGAAAGVRWTTPWRSARPPRLAGVEALLRRHGGPLPRTRTSDGDGPRQGVQAGGDPPPTRMAGPSTWPRASAGRAASSHPGRQNRDEPPRRHPDRAPAGQAGRDDQAHLAALIAPQLHHRRPRCRGAAAGRADRRPPRRPEDDHPI